MRKRWRCLRSFRSFGRFRNCGVCHPRRRISSGSARSVAGESYREKVVLAGVPPGRILEDLGGQGRVGISADYSGASM